MIDLRLPLAVLASRMPWQEIEASLAHNFARKVKAGKPVDDIGLFGPTVQVVGGGISNAGRPPEFDTKSHFLQFCLIRCQ